MREYTKNILLNPKKNIEIKQLPPFDIADYDLTNEKELAKYFKSIERICRMSRSYKAYIDYLRNETGMMISSFSENVDNIDTYNIKIQIHHSPFTLYDIVTTIYSKRMTCGESITENAIAKEVMYNHYKFNVGLIPLSETEHELVHSGFLFIPTNRVFGNYKRFVDIYGAYMDPQLRATLEQVEQATALYNHKEETKVLTYQPMYINADNVYSLPKTEDVISLLKDRIKNIDTECLRGQYYTNNSVK